MPNPYPLLYRVGFTPWEGATDDGPIPQLLDELPPGAALDAGCGTGRLAVSLAERGWTVTGVDSVAKQRADAAGLTGRTRFLKADVTSLDGPLGASTFDLVTDIGCLHGLTRPQQRAFASWVGAHTTAGATVVLLAALPRSGIGPKGIDEASITGLFGSPWSLESATTSPFDGAGPLRGATFRWYVLRR